MASSAHPLRGRGSVPGSGGGVFVSELQRTRLLEAAFAVVVEDGYRGMAVRRVAERAGVSSKTFYDLFSDREDCFLAAFDYGIGELACRVRPVFEAQQDWVVAVREGLGVLLGVLDGEPALRWLLFVEALAVGPRVLLRRAEVLGELAVLVDRGRVGAKDSAGLPPLTAEGVVGAAFSVIHSRLSERDPKPLSGLLNGLMATIVLPYRGRAAASQQLAYPVSKAGSGTLPTLPEGPDHRGLNLDTIDEPVRSPGRGAGSSGGPGRTSGSRAVRPLGSMPPSDFRLTVRRQMVLAAIAEMGERGVHPNNREVSELVGVADQGQISRLMMQLQQQALVENTLGQGLSKAWRLSTHGEEAINTNRPLAGKHASALWETGRPESEPPAARGPKGGVLVAPVGELGAGFRLTTRTHLVLGAVNELDRGGSFPSNREVAGAAGVRDRGQISKLLARLESRGLLLNTGGQTAGIPNAWQLTPHGHEVLHQVSREPRVVAQAVKQTTRKTMIGRSRGALR